MSAHPKDLVDCDQWPLFRPSPLSAASRWRRFRYWFGVKIGIT